MDEREIRRLEMNRVLVELARASAEAEEPLETAFARIARAAAETLAVERVSVWLYNEDRSAIRCAELYELTPDRRSRGQELSAPSYPSYFQALESERTIAADEARSDPRTREFTAGYLEPLGITSMLDAPIRAGGRMIGVVCHEHVGPVRPWTEDEQGFAASIADAASLALEGNERRRTEAERSEILAREQAAWAEAEEANRIKDEFLATVSHELRTPLSAMIGWVHLLRTGSLDAASTERALETIDRNIRAQSKIIDDILDVSRIIRGNLKLDLVPIDLAALLHETVESLRPTAEAKGVALHTVLETPESRLTGDPGRLQQVVWNLLSNAVKFTPRGGGVEIRLSRRGDDLRLEVTDTGEGIEPEFLPHVFERFRQADGSMTRVHGGLGLGLAMVRHLVELHGGTATASSPGSGQGSRFVVTLPALPASEPGRAARLTPPC